MFLAFLFQALFTTPALAKLLLSLTELNAQQYDFIIVGGGTSGGVLANRLTEDPKTRVLVIEAGGSNEGILNSVIPFLGVTLPRTPVDWNFTTARQQGLNGRTVPYTRGHVLGGTSSINLMTWNRGSNDLWDKWANLTGDSGWSWKSVKKYYLKTSRLVAPADGHNTTGQVIPSSHGKGPVEVSVPGFPTELDDRVINTSKQLNGRFPFNEDLNAGNFVGFNVMQSSIGHGRRSSSATAYLNPAQIRPNLDVLISTRVTKIIQSELDGKLPVFKTVEIVHSASGLRHRIEARKELILSAGVIGTPHLLLLSGIGPKVALEKRGIRSLVDLPDVGQNLMDHPLLPNYFTVNSTKTFDAVLRDPALIGQKIKQWTTQRQGLFVLSPGNTQGFMRLPENSSIFKTFEDPAAGPLSAHTEFIFVDGFAALGTLPQPPTGNFMSLLTVVVSPLARGSVSLASSNVFDDPIIDPGLLSSDFDLFAMVQAMKDALTFLQSASWRGFVSGPYGDLAKATTEDAMAAFARNNSVTANHAVGTARMSPAKEQWGVVDSGLLLKRSLGLRIVDASIFPTIPECHIQAVVYTVAERAADLIKAKHAGNH